MKQIQSPREDNARTSEKHSIAQLFAAISLICAALSGCASPARRAVQDVTSAWTEHRSLPNIDETLTIKSAYEVQTNSVRAKLKGATPAGFKAGLTSPATQERFKVDHAVAGVLFKEGARKSGDTMRLNELHGLYVEVEIALRVGATIDRAVPDVAALKTFIDGIAPALELPNLDYVEPQALDVVDIVATNVAASNFIVGPFVSPQDRDPNAAYVALECNRQRMFSASARDALGDQWQAALWLVNKMVEEGWRLEPGQVLLTGSLGRAVPAKAGHCIAYYQADDSEWPTLEVNVTE